MRGREGTLRASAGRSILRRFSASERPGTAPAAAGPARRRGVAPRGLVMISNKIWMGSLPGSRSAAVAPIGPRRVLFARCPRRVGRGSKPPPQPSPQPSAPQRSAPRQSTAAESPPRSKRAQETPPSLALMKRQLAGMRRAQHLLDAAGLMRMGELEYDIAQRESKMARSSQ